MPPPDFLATLSLDAVRSGCPSHRGLRSIRRQVRAVCLWVAGCVWWALLTPACLLGAPSSCLRAVVGGPCCLLPACLGRPPLACGSWSARSFSFPCVLASFWSSALARAFLPFSLFASFQSSWSAFCGYILPSFLPLVLFPSSASHSDVSVCLPKLYTRARSACYQRAVGARVFAFWLTRF